MSITVQQSPYSLDCYQFISHYVRLHLSQKATASPHHIITIIILATMQTQSPCSPSHHIMFRTNYERQKNLKVSVNTKAIKALRTNTLAQSLSMMKLLCNVIGRPTNHSLSRYGAKMPNALYGTHYYYEYRQTTESSSRTIY